jgi:division protein CdvB (Snf7/Vps24/ESCRT-III family)
MFWLEECQYILSVKVHRNNGEWTTDCADRLPGPTRDAMRQNETRRKVNNRSEAKFRDSCLDGSVKEAMAKESILCSKAKRAKDKVKIVKTKLKMLEKMKEEYVEHNGEEKYAQKRAQLMNTLMDVGDEEDVSPSVATEQDADDEAI